MNKQGLLGILIILFCGFFYFQLFQPPLVPYDLTNNQPATDCYLSYSGWRYIFEPFSLVSEYFLNACDWRKTLIFVYFWFLVTALILKIRFWQATLVYLTIIALSIIFPLVCPKIHPVFPQIAVDFHSHTYYSHDAIVSPEQNLLAHRRAGFSGFFLTEHDKVNNLSLFSRQKTFVLPGVQINTTAGISLLVLSQKEFVLDELKNLSVGKLIEKAHQKNMLVILPHWWKWQKPPVEELIKSGIDGIEIYNTAYRQRANSDKLCQLARKNNLFTIGSTDWHGWGNYTNVWTVIKSSDINVFWQTKNRFLITRVIVYNPAKKLTTFQHFFEPYFILTDYWRRSRIVNILALTLWLLGIYWLNKYKKISLRLKLIVSAIIGVILLITSIKFFIIWLVLYPQNNTLFKISSVFFLLAVGWSFLAKNIFVEYIKTKRGEG